MNEAGTKRANGALVLVALLVVVAVLGGLPLLKGGFYIAKHEGDTLHLAELVLRMADGEWPHLDFMTPIGVLAIAPITLFIELGTGLGHAIFLSQVLVALVLLPAVAYVARSRMWGFWPYVYGVFVMVLCVALVHGEAESSVSISMHYNRWAWAVAYIIVPLALLVPLGRERPVVDGTLIGLGLALLALAKITYFAALAPGILIALLARRQWGAILAAGVAGLAVAGILTLLAGPAFWDAYLRDLLTVMGSDIRAKPGHDFLSTVAAPLYMGVSLTLVAAVILLRQAGRAVEGMALLFLMPGFFYIVYQNYGNDPQWLVLLGILVFLLRPAPGTANGLGLDLRDALRVTGLVAFAFALPSVVNLVYSPFRHLAASTEDTVPILPRAAALQDILVYEPRLYRVNTLQSFDGPDTPFAAYRERGQREEENEAFFNGEKLPECGLEGGMNAWFEVVTADLAGSGYAGKAIMSADIFSLYWAFGDFPRVRGAAPWYYGGLPGAENADYVLVPLCPTQASLRAEILKAFDDGGWSLTEVRRTPLYILAEAKRPASP